MWAPKVGMLVLDTRHGVIVTSSLPFGCETAQMGLQGCEMGKLCIILLVWLPTKGGCSHAHSINKALYVSAMQDAAVEVLLKN